MTLQSGQNCIKVKKKNHSSGDKISDNGSGFNSLNHRDLVVIFIEIFVLERYILFISIFCTNEACPCLLSTPCAKQNLTKVNQFGC